MCRFSYLPSKQIAQRALRYIYALYAVLSFANLTRIHTITMFSKTTLSFWAAALVAGSNAHMIMNTPTPYGIETLTTSPLNGEGINFPCQAGDRTDWDEAEGASNPMKIGESNLLNFTGSAVHGGGSCQLSVTYDFPPPADKSKWKVIHSFVGSCPAQAAGNLETLSITDAQGRPESALCTGSETTECLKQFYFDLPDGLKNGNATLAWTWFNKLGNREMYMNCAPITITGGSDNDTLYDSLPEVFVANIPGECTTETTGGVISFPNPGQYVTYGEAVTPGANGDCASASDNSTSSSTASDSGSTAVAASYSSAATTSEAAVTGYSESVATSAAVAVSSVAYSASAYSTAVSTASSSSSNSSSSSSSCGDSKVSCSIPGDVICIGTAQFGLCNIDYCAIPQALAAGTTCSDGSITKRSDDDAVVVRRRRSRTHSHVAGNVHKHRL